MKYLDNLIAIIKSAELTDMDGVRETDYDRIINKLVPKFLKHRNDDSLLFFIGNGGSAAIASHMTADYMKNGGMRTYSLYDNAVMTCMGNDYGYEYTFSKPLSFLIDTDDLLVAISSSGESKNIIRAIEVAKDKNANVITLTGFRKNNTVSRMGDMNVYVPSDKYGMVESIHNLMLQQIVDEIKDRDGIAL